MIGNMLPSEACAVVATIDPDAYTATTYNSDVIDMSLFESLMVVLMAGTLGSGATLAAAVHTSAAAGSGFAALTGKATTALTEAGTDSDKQAIINLRAEDLPDGHRYVRIVATLGTATSDFGVVVFGVRPRRGPANDNDLASVAEIVA